MCGWNGRFYLKRAVTKNAHVTFTSRLIYRIENVSAEYKSYLLRLQRNQVNEHWRASLQNAQTGELLHFANERELLRYLLQVLLPQPTNMDLLTNLDTPDP